MKPRVLYVTPIFGYPPYGGPRLRTYNTVRALARCADVTLFLTQQPDTEDRESARGHMLGFCHEVVFPEPPPGPTLARRLIHAAVPRGVRAHARNFAEFLGTHINRRFRDGTDAADPMVGGESHKAAPRGRAAAVLDGLRQRIEEMRPDVVWLGFGGISYDLVPLARETGARVVLETECVWSRFILRELPFTGDERRRDQILREGRSKEAEERGGASEVDVTTAVSEVDADYFRSIAPAPERVMLLANVIDVDAYAEPVPPARMAQPAVVFAGTLSHGTANVDAAVWLIEDVMPRVWQRRPDVHLYVVGRSPAPPIVGRDGPRVHVTGEVPSIVPYMRGSVAALVPLRWESGTRFKILEAFACQTPVVSTTLGAEGLEVEHGRHLLLADDAQDFAQAIVAVVDDAALRTRLSEPSYQLVKAKYDLSAAERQIDAVLMRLGFATVAVS